jgi:hypothetical protein
MKNFNIYLIVFFPLILNVSCASTEQLNTLDRKVSDLSTLVSAFNQRYAYVLNENKALKELHDKIHITSTKVSETLFEAMKVEADGSNLTIEIF